jgi:hypothetical protein
VISLNILTQLEALPERLLKKKSNATADGFIRFKREIQEKHIGFLRKHISVLISDEAEIIIKSDGTQTENITLLAELPEGRISERWTWDFDLIHADFNKRRSKFKVVAKLF